MFTAIASILFYRIGYNDCYCLINKSLLLETILNQSDSTGALENIDDNVVQHSNSSELNYDIPGK